MKKKPQRMCVSCKTRADKKDLMRVVVLQDGDIAYDPSGRLPGRGSYLCRKRECIMAELKAQRLQKGLRHKIDDDDLKAMAEELLKQCEEEEGSEET